jgi:hypothetical protein
MTRFPMHTRYFNSIPSHSSPTKSRTVLRRSRKESGPIDDPAVWVKNGLSMMNSIA